MNYSSFFIPYISPTHTKEELSDIIVNTLQIGQVGNIDIVLSRKGNYMAFIHMSSIFVSDKTNKIFSIIQEQGQYYLYDIKKRMKLILKQTILYRRNLAEYKTSNSGPLVKQYESDESNSKTQKQIEAIINKKFIGVNTEIENIKHILYDIQRKIYGYTISHSHIGNIQEMENSWC